MDSVILYPPPTPTHSIEAISKALSLPEFSDSTLKPNVAERNAFAASFLILKNIQPLIRSLTTFGLVAGLLRRLGDDCPK